MNTVAESIPCCVFDVLWPSWGQGAVALIVSVSALADIEAGYLAGYKGILQ